MPNDDTEFAPRPETGRVFVARRRVRLGDTDPSGQLRLDALARYLQDVATDDSRDAGLERASAWVVRQTTVKSVMPPRLGEELTLATFCAGIGSHFARRRTTVVGDKGAHVEIVALWVHIDATSGRPVRLSNEFHQIYAGAAGGTRIRARLTHPDPPSDLTGQPWVLRSTDLDVFAHVNNAVYWVGVEEALAQENITRRIGRSEMEHRSPVLGTEEVNLAWIADDDQVRVWFRVSTQVRASATVARL
ncbi:MAG: acyl-[acyl-carrier-protein] thioesterase [Acidimicrobiales bacterium]